ncbi:hypothetical protein ACFC6L_34790 [Kitasatospora phosalacinea]|uniref:hypothetical protein n=1 Tax=Kitasatospora phosalacinea TaxID=2065 RepID=UPI0035D5D031
METAPVWAVSNRHATGLSILPPSRLRPVEPLDSEQRAELAQRLLTDDSIRLEDRVAGLLVILFAQPLSTIVEIRADQVIRNDHNVHLLLANEPLHLPGQLGSLIQELVTARKSHAVIGRGSDNPWLFPGKNTLPEAPAQPRC